MACLTVNTVPFLKEKAEESYHVRVNPISRLFPNKAAGS